MPRPLPIPAFLWEEFSLLAHLACHARFSSRQDLGMALAQVGPLTTVFEAAATAVGAGIVLGSVVMGTAGLALGWSRQEIGSRALTDGYFGGIAGAVVALSDIVLRYAI